MTDQERAAAIKRICGEYTQGELHRAFSVVAPAENWKRPIKAIVPTTMRAVIRAAIIHFTGSVPTFTPCPNGTQVQVEAAGYYAAIGS